EDGIRDRNVTGVQTCALPISAAGIPGVSSAVASSTVLRTIERLTPRPVDEALARARSGLLEVSVLPTIDGLIEDADLALAPDLRSEERRVGTEWRSTG